MPLPNLGKNSSPNTDKTRFILLLYTMDSKNYYTIWYWHDAPYTIRLASPLDSQGTWIVKLEPGHDFPHEVLSIKDNPEWEVENKLIEGMWYTFIKDPKDIPYPEFDPVQFDFSGYGYGDWVNNIYPYSDKMSGPFDAKIDFPSDEK